MPTLAHQASTRPPLWADFPGIPRAEVLRLRRINWASPARQAERDGILALSDQADAAQARAAAAYQAGRRHGAAGAAAGYCATHAEDIANAFAAGQRDAATQARGGARAMEIGWNAAMTRFGREIGSRSRPTTGPTDAEQRMWTRHHPSCRHSSGTAACADAGCLPGPRADYGKRAPWDEKPEQLRARAAASWARKGAA